MRKLFAILLLIVNAILVVSVLRGGKDVNVKDEKKNLIVSPKPTVFLSTPSPTPVVLKDIFIAGKVQSKDSKYIVITFNEKPFVFGYDKTTVFRQRTMLVVNPEEKNPSISIKEISVGDLIEAHGVFKGGFLNADKINKIIENDK